MQIFPYSFEEIPKINSYTVTPQNTTLDFKEGVVEENIFMKLHDVAKILAEHIDIISESRELIKKGETITWKELLKVEQHALKQTK